VRDATAAKFPDGPRRCLGLAGAVVGVHLPTAAGANWFPSTGPTSPVRHAFLFYAALAADPVPELIGALAAAGVLHRTTVDWTVDTETSGPGPEVVGATGYRYRPAAYHHEIAVILVGLYLTEPQAEEFEYQNEFVGYAPSPSMPPTRLPSRMYDAPLPPADVHYQVPVVVPYVLSVAAAACYPETVAEVSDVRALHGWDGRERVEATVTFAPHPAAWMAAPAFRRAAVGPSTEPIDRLRRVVLAFEPTWDGTLNYVTEVRRP